MSKEQWILFDRNWADDNSDVSVENECMLTVFDRLEGESAVGALVRWVRSWDDMDWSEQSSDSEYFDRSDAFSGYEVIGPGEALKHGQLDVTFLKSARLPDERESSPLRATVLRLRCVRWHLPKLMTKAGGSGETVTIYVSVDPWHNATVIDKPEEEATTS